MKMKRPWWHWLVGWFILWFAIATPWFALMGIRLWDAHKMFSSYMKAVKEERFKAAYAFCGQDFQRATTFDMFKGWQHNLGPLLSYNVESIDVWGNLGISKGSISAEEDHSKVTVRISYLLRYVGGRWKIYGVKELSPSPIALSFHQYPWLPILFQRCNTLFYEHSHSWNSS